MNLDLKGKFALVTGGSRGIGFAIATGLAREGCHIAICARKKSGINAAVRKLKESGVRAVGFSADVLNPKDIDKVTKGVMRSFPTLHILVNNVGGGGSWGTPSVEETSEQVWVDVYNKNTMAAIRFTRFFLPYMRKQRWGRVVTTSSIQGREGGGRPWYTLAKSAEISLMKCLAMNPELTRDGVTFNSVAPGAIMIPGTGWEAKRNKDPQNFEKMVRAVYPMGRLGTPEEVAHVVVFLCSSKASLINGAAIAIDGGEGRSF